MIGEIGRYLYDIVAGNLGLGSDSLNYHKLNSQITLQYRYMITLSDTAEVAEMSMNELCFVPI